MRPTSSVGASRPVPPSSTGTRACRSSAGSPLWQKLNEHVKFRGVIAWFAWLAIHLFYLVGFRNRFAAVVSWLVAFAGTKRPGFIKVDEFGVPRAAPTTEELRAS